MFSCVSTCRAQGTYRLSPVAQAMRNCVLPGFDTATWTGERLVRVHMGKPRDWSREGQGDWAAPVEDIAAGGCPGSWYRTAFVESVLRYYRRRDDHGGRVANPLLDRCDDPLVIEAVLALEGYEDAAAAEYQARVLAKHAKG